MSEVLEKDAHVLKLHLEANKHRVTCYYTVGH